MKFSEAIVEVLSRRHSDHNPLLLRCGGYPFRRGDRPFQFEAAWCTHEGYVEVVRKAWERGNGDVAKSLDYVRQDSMVFNKEVFGNIHTRKKALESRLRGIERTLERVDSLRLLHNYHATLREYELTLFQEETLWFQKSREDWIRFGNTAKEREDTWAFLGFGVSTPLIPHLLRLPASLISQLGEAPTMEEVHSALLSMPSYKAPGPDGFQAFFYKMYWDQIGSEIWKLVRDAFVTGSFDPQISNILVTLIPKCEDPKRLKDFRPISLCNVIHKLISKVLVIRLRPWLNELVSPLQTSFISGRSPVDNAIVLQEIIHSMKKLRKMKGNVVYKLDIEKAYDKVEWSFMEQVLNEFGFPPNIVRLVMHSLSSPSISVLWNGKKTSPFFPKRGLRQGDSLSPYLFMLCLEKLGAMITGAVQEGRWEPFRLPHGGPSISLLFFADDILLFVQAKPSQVRFMVGLLERFSAVSGLHFNPEKSKGHVSVGVPPQVAGHVRFWYDVWLGNSALCLDVPYVHFRDVNLQVCEVLQQGKWNLDILHTPIPDTLRQRIEGLSMTLHHSLPDVWVWNGALSGRYTAYEGYKWLLAREDGIHDSVWGWIWRLKIPENLKFFLWQLAHECIPSAQFLVSRHMGLDTLCQCCHQTVEDAFHIFFGCDVTVSL
uniref:Retrovirus-related Pol polyprotein LINE-1 n=1 Tax=Cajanus cajan TaxID=3821 RepID=A0A151SEY5_CAJCA|nr:Retrovirus-related Pol polyprotein LINE-1 [Cajanus cajan]